MEQFFDNLFSASIYGSIIIFAVIILRLILRKTPKKYICLLWLLAGIRLLNPIEIRSDLSLQPKLVLPVSTIADLEWVSVLPWVWGSVAICFAVYSFLSYRNLKNQVRDAVRVQGNWESDRIETAFILGFIKPQIYIPMGMKKQSRNHIIEHERTHLEKGDHWIKMIGFIALSLHWFNPLVWIAYIMLCKDIEMACDERVVQFMELEERKSYSAALLSCSGTRMHFAASPVAFGEVSVKQRIKSILRYKKPVFWISLLGVLAFFFVAICFVTSPTEEPLIIDSLPVVEDQQAQDANEVKACVENAWNRILSGERYHLFFADQSYDGGVGWQVNVYKKGEDTLWLSTDHIGQEGNMMLEGIQYKFIDGSDGGWVPYEEEDTLLGTMLAYFSIADKTITDISMDIRSADSGYKYEKISFHAHSIDEKGKPIVQPMTMFFDAEGNVTEMRVENTDRKGVDIFCFSNWSDNSSDINNLDTIFQNARENRISVEDVHPSKLQPATQDELLMKEWGILYRMDDDLLTRYGGDIWFCQLEGYETVICTDNRYWIEKRTDSGWVKMDMISDPEWEHENYTLGRGKYTSLSVDWLDLYGPLPGGTYRFAKQFTKMENGGQSCVGYAEFTIYYNDASSAEQIAAVERCYAGLEELKQRDYIHYLSTNEIYSTDEVWSHDKDYVQESIWYWKDAAGVTVNSDGEIIPRVDISVRMNGVGYSQARENPYDLSSKVLGMEIATLSPNTVSWSLSGIKDCMNIFFFERSNATITFPEGIGLISDNIVRFQQTWPVQGLEVSEFSAILTYKFDEDGNLYYMEYKTDTTNGVISIEVYDTAASEIDAKIQTYTDKLIVDTFSWETDKAKYTAEEFNIRKSGFANKGGTSISGPEEAARLALQEYPNLIDYLSVDVLRDETAGMWKVTVEAYVNYQDTYAYRDIYISDNGETQLLVYEGPISYGETRK